MKIDGSVTRLTHFEDSTPGSQLSGFTWTEIIANQIAFWFDPYPMGPDSPDDPGYHLVFQDISTGKITNTCISCSLKGTCNYLSTLLFSLPGKNAIFVVISATAEDNPSEFGTYLFDIDQQTLSKIAPGYMFGWLTNKTTCFVCIYVHKGKP